MQLPPLPHVICDDRVTGVASSTTKRRECSVHEEFPMMPALPGWQATVRLSSVSMSAVRTATRALVAALLAEKALVKNVSSYSPAGRSVAVVWLISEVALPQPNLW